MFHPPAKTLSLVQLLCSDSVHLSPALRCADSFATLVRTQAFAELRRQIALGARPQGRALFRFSVLLHSRFQYTFLFRWMPLMDGDRFADIRFQICSAPPVVRTTYRERSRTQLETVAATMPHWRELSAPNARILVDALLRWLDWLQLRPFSRAEASGLLEAAAEEASAGCGLHYELYQVSLVQKAEWILSRCDPVLRTSLRTRYDLPETQADLADIERHAEDVMRELHEQMV